MKTGWSKEKEQFVKLSMEIEVSPFQQISALDQKNIFKNQKNIAQFVKEQYARASKVQRTLRLQHEFGDFLEGPGQEIHHQHIFVECYLSAFLADNLLNGTFSFFEFEHNRSYLIRTLPNSDAKQWQPEKRPYNEEKSSLKNLSLTRTSKRSPDSKNLSLKKCCCVIL